MVRVCVRPAEPVIVNLEEFNEEERLVHEARNRQERLARSRGPRQGLGGGGGEL